MVRKTRRSAFKGLCYSLFTLQLLLLLAGCGTASKVTVVPAFAPAPEQDIVYVIPFLTTLVPENFNETAFNTFVDRLNASRSQTDVKWFFIIKEELKDIDPVWLARQVYITGEAWSYIENSGCCQTEMRVKARVQLFQGGKKDPAVEIFAPLENFFDHDLSTIEIERNRFAQMLATELADQVIKALAKGSKPGP